MVTPRLEKNQKVRLVSMPDGQYSKDLPLTVGNIYEFLHYDGSNVVTTTDKEGVDGHYWQGRVEPVVPKKVSD